MKRVISKYKKLLYIRKHCVRDNRPLTQYASYEEYLYEQCQEEFLRALRSVRAEFYYGTIFADPSQVPAIQFAGTGEIR